MTIDTINQLDQAAFVEALGWVFEHSPWVAERAWASRPFTSITDLHQAMRHQVLAATRDEQLHLLCSHPDLGARAVMTTASTSEQSGAGLDQLTPDEFHRLHTANRTYREKFGFPFLYAVKGSTKYGILDAIESRVQLQWENEFQTALLQVFKIAGFRLDDLMEWGIALESFASGWKRNYYGKGDVTVYRLNRDGHTPSGGSAVFAANVKMLLYGDAFWQTYTTGDNTGLIATDSMKNFIQRETMNFTGSDLESYARFLAEKFLGLYPQVEGLQLSVAEMPYGAQGNFAFSPSGPEQATARIEINQTGIVEAASGIRGFRMLRLGGSAFKGFVRDQYTTLPDIENRPLHMWLDLEWNYMQPDKALTDGTLSRKVAAMTHEMFDAFESGSIQQVIYQLGTRLLAELPELSEIHLEANNRTWDTVAEQGDLLGVYTDARPPYGCLGLRLKR